MTPHGGEAIDCLYLVRPGDSNLELLMSMRSLANAPFIRDVWIVGHKPPWVENVNFIPAPKLATKYETTTANLLTACRDDRMTESVLMMHDDIFIVQEIDRVPVLHRGPIAGVVEEYRRRGISRSRYVQGMQETLDLLVANGYPEPLSYELHVPMTIDRTSMAETLEWVQQQPIDVPHKRSIWSNLAQVGGEFSHDVKLVRPTRKPPEGPFLSSSDRMFHRTASPVVRRLFPNPSPYERARASRTARRAGSVAARR